MEGKVASPRGNRVGTCARPEVAVELVSRGRGSRFYTACVGYARYQEDQPELIVQCLLYGVDAVILGLGDFDSISGEVIGSSM